MRECFFLPRAVIQKWRDDGAQVTPSDPTTGRSPYISDSDLIAAWLVKLTAASFSSRSGYSVVGANNARSLLSQVNTKKGVYLQNLLVISYCSVSPDEAAGSITCVALAIRRGLSAQLTEVQMIHHFRRHRSEMEAGQGDGVQNFFCRGDETVVLYNNFAGLRITSTMDFGPAVLANADGTYSSGTVVNHFYGRVKRSAYVRPLFVVLDQQDGSYFICCDAALAVWTMIEEVIGAATALN